MTRALFLDRDGIINHEVGYLYRSVDVLWVDGIFSLSRAAISLGYKLVVITNQSGIARGFYSETDFHALMAFISAEFLAQGAPLSAVYFCPFHPTHGVGPYKKEHPDRKPGPGMLLRAAADLSLDLPNSILLGDRCSDLAAANAAHLRQAFLLLGTEPGPCPGDYRPIQHLSEAEAWLTANP